MEEEVVEFNIAHNRKYSIDHLWYQEKDDEKIMVGISEFMGVEIGEVLRVILPQAETMVDEGQDMFCLLYTSPSPRDVEESRMPSSA